MSNLIDFEIRYTVRGGEVHRDRRLSVSQEQAVKMFFADRAPADYRILTITRAAAPCSVANRDPEVADQAFLVEDDGDVYYRDSEGLEKVLRNVATDAAYGSRTFGELHVWRWLGNGLAEELSLTCEGGHTFDGEDYAYPTWRAVAPDGVVYAEVTVRIDGRA